MAFCCYAMVSSYLFFLTQAFCISTFSYILPSPFFHPDRLCVCYSIYSLLHQCWRTSVFFLRGRIFLQTILYEFSCCAVRTRTLPMCPGAGKYTVSNSFITYSSFFLPMPFLPAYLLPYYTAIHTRFYLTYP